jgi:hypothetical protein
MVKNGQIVRARLLMYFSGKTIFACLNFELPGTYAGRWKISFP